MPSPQNITRKYLVEIYSVEAPRFNPEVRGGAAHQNLSQEKEGNYQEKLDGGSLALTCSTGQHMRMDMGACAFPTEVIELPESKTRAVPTSRAMRLMALQRTASPPGVLPTSVSNGKLLV